ncbi:unnamed protein product [Brassicogethes aeneus]|uniref:DUF4806 domain-containing protein n=1 Tax=Brassicogethes aeneus TaxID=1431903 RepID=A0A9P0B422_BRAAE|nr:unnamed protein product [Brassicogethes aeneus]
MNMEDTFCAERQVKMRKDLHKISKRQMRRRVNVDFKSLKSLLSNVKVNGALKQDGKIINETNIVENAISFNSSRSRIDEVVGGNTVLTKSEKLKVDNGVSETHNDAHIDPNILPQMNSSIESEIRGWAIKYNVTTHCLNALLGILRNHIVGSSLPKDCRTLMHTPKLSSILKMDPGLYKHFGIEKAIRCLFLKNNIVEFHNNVVEIGLNIDGLPISNSSKSQFWPILITIRNLPNKAHSQVFPVGIYYGTGKPKSLQDFMQPFINDIENLKNNGLHLCNKNLAVQVVNIICDAPAKAYLLNVKAHNGYHGCNYCTDEGDFINRRMVFLQRNADLRTDESFRLRSDEEYHRDGPSPLEQIGIGLVSSVPLDYMHLICIGVIKRLIIFWVKGPRDLRLSVEAMSSMNSNIRNIREYIPEEFSRLPRPLEEIDYWKATELRLFVLYTGALVLRGHLPRIYYNHFLLLHCASKILVSVDTYLTSNDLAKKLLNKFVQQYAELYGSEFVTHNVHNLIHISDHTKVHGTLDEFSAFPYENYLQHLKKLFRKSPNALQQVCNRLEEEVSFLGEQRKEAFNYSLPILTGEIENFSDKYKIYKTLRVEDLLIKINGKDNYLMLKSNKFVEVQSIVKKEQFIILVVKSFLEISPLYVNPCESSLLTEVLAEHYFSEPFEVEYSEVKFKCMYIPVASNNKAALLALKHKVLYYFTWAIFPKRTLILFFRLIGTKKLLMGTYSFWPKSKVQQKNVCALISKAKEVDKDWELFPILFYMGHFPEEDTYSVFPSNWYKEAADGNTYSFWPKSKVQQKNICALISKAKEVDKDWELFPVTVLGKYTTYDEARQREAHLQKLSGSESDGKKSLGRGKRKKTLRRLSYSSDDDNLQPGDEQIIVPSRKVSKPKETHAKNTLPAISQPPSSSPSSSSREQCVIEQDYMEIEDIENNLSGSSEDLNPDDSDLESNKISEDGQPEQPLEPSSFRILAQYAKEVIIEDKTLETKEDIILKELVNIKNYVVANNKALDEIKLLILNGSSTSPNCGNMQELETMLATSEDLQVQVMQMLLKLGGENGRKFIRQSYRKLFSTVLEKQCSWTGAKENKKIKDLLVVKVVKEASMKLFHLSECDFDKESKEWFRTAKQRSKRFLAKFGHENEAEN